jgi:hypothetical protein
MLLHGGRMFVGIANFSIAVFHSNACFVFLVWCNNVIRSIRQEQSFCFSPLLSRMVTSAGISTQNTNGLPRTSYQAVYGL